MTELLICAIIVLLAFAASLYRLLNAPADAAPAPYAEQWWWTLPM